MSNNTKARICLAIGALLVVGVITCFVLARLGDYPIAVSNNTVCRIHRRLDCIHRLYDQSDRRHGRRRRVKTKKENEMMNKLNLKANNDYEKSILKYLEENASDFLAMKINQGNKTLQSCFSYIQSMAKKKAKNGCAMIEDAVVFGWAIHYFEEDEIEAEVKVKAKATPEPKEIVKKTEKKQAKTVEKNEEQLSLFALLG